MIGTEAGDPPPPPGGLLDIAGILKALPHRFPFVLVDRVLGWEARRWLEAVKQVSGNEPWLPGHFPDEPIFPGVLQIEAAAQASALLVHLSEPGQRGLLVFGQVKRFTFVRPVRPGDELHIRIEQVSKQDTQGLAEATLTVGGEAVSRGTLAYGKLPSA